MLQPLLRDSISIVCIVVTSGINDLRAAARFLNHEIHVQILSPSDYLQVMGTQLGPLRCIDTMTFQGLFFWPGMFRISGNYAWKTGQTEASGGRILSTLPDGVRDE